MLEEENAMTYDEPNENGNGVDMDSAEILHMVTQSTRHKLLLNVISHPDQAPSLEELKFQNPGTRSTLTEHLEKLEDAGVVEKITLPPGERRRDLPHNFYTLTTSGRRFLEKHDLIPADPGPLQAAYDRTEKPERIQQCEDADRPGSLSKEAKETHDAPDEIDAILSEYKDTGDAEQAGKEIIDIEGGGDMAEDQDASMGILEQLFATVSSLEARVDELESELRAQADDV
jgi:DNA-binding MarR family transcriptional regulator